MPLSVPIDPQRDHIRGQVGSPLSVVEYGDLECPACRGAYFELHDVEHRMAGELCIVFRHFPLSRIHPHSVAAAEIAEAAGEQARFWEMHDLLFENQSSLEYPDLFRYAARLSLDMELVEKALSTHKFLPRVRDDFFGGVRSGVNGTPSIYINGRRHDGSWDASSIVFALKQARYPRTITTTSSSRTRARARRP